MDKFYSDKDKVKEKMLAKVRSRLFFGEGEFFDVRPKRIIVKLLYDFLSRQMLK